jgi:hypothetical protein
MSKRYDQVILKDKIHEEIEYSFTQKRVKSKWFLSQGRAFAMVWLAKVDSLWMIICEKLNTYFSAFKKVRILEEWKSKG